MSTRHLVVALFSVLVLPTIARAQMGTLGTCTLLDNESVSRTTQNGFAILSVRGPLLVRCSGGAELRANEANIFEATSEVHLYGNVEFEDAERRLTSDNAVYSGAIRRLHSTGNVVYTDVASGSTLRGPEMEYYRPGPGRPEAQVIATQRPHLTLYPQGEEGAPEEPLEVDADRVSIVGQNALSASGSVVLQRSDLDGVAREAEYDRASGELELRGDARLTGERYDLAGEEIQARAPASGIEQVTARQDAELASEELKVAAPELQLFFANDMVERLLARGLVSEVPPEGDAASRPTVTARGFRLEADSLEAISPGQQLEQVIAIGRARGEAIDTLAEGTADTPTRTARALESEGSSAVALSVQTDRDWLAGDTITGFFAARIDSLPAPADTTAAAEQETELERLVARGSARSLYRVRSDTARAEAEPTLNYLAGDTIELRFARGELNTAEVQGLRRGAYLTPAPAPAPDDSAGDESPPAGRTNDPGAAARPQRRGR